MLPARFLYLSLFGRFAWTQSACNIRPYDQIAIGILDSRALSTFTIDDYAALQQYLSANLQTNVTIVDFTSAPDVDAAFRAAASCREVDFVFASPLRASCLSSELSLPPIASSTVSVPSPLGTYNVYTSFSGGVAVVKANSNISSLAEIRGHSVVMSSPISLSGLPQLFWASSVLGIDVPSSASSVSLVKSDAFVLYAVAHGLASIGFIETTVMNSLTAEGYFNASDFKILDANWTSDGNLLVINPALPEYVVLALPHTSLNVQKRLTVALFSVPMSVLVRTGHASFIPPSDYSRGLDELTRMGLRDPLSGECYFSKSAFDLLLMATTCPDGYLKKSAAKIRASPSPQCPKPSKPAVFQSAIGFDPIELPADWLSDCLSNPCVRVKSSLSTGNIILIIVSSILTFSTLVACGLWVRSRRVNRRQELQWLIDIASELHALSMISRTTFSSVLRAEWGEKGDVAVKVVFISRQQLLKGRVEWTRPIVFVLAVIFLSPPTFRKFKRRYMRGQTINSGPAQTQMMTRTTPTATTVGGSTMSLDSDKMPSRFPLDTSISHKGENSSTHGSNHGWPMAARSAHCSDIEEGDQGSSDKTTPSRSATASGEDGAKFVDVKAPSMGNLPALSNGPQQAQMPPMMDLVSEAKLNPHSYPLAMKRVSGHDGSIPRPGGLMSDSGGFAHPGPFPSGASVTGLRSVDPSSANLDLANSNTLHSKSLFITEQGPTVTVSKQVTSARPHPTILYSNSSLEKKGSSSGKSATLDRLLAPRRKLSVTGNNSGSSPLMNSSLTKPSVMPIKQLLMAAQSAQATVVGAAAPDLAVQSNASSMNGSSRRRDSVFGVVPLSSRLFTDRSSSKRAAISQSGDVDLAQQAELAGGEARESETAVKISLNGDDGRVPAPKSLLRGTWISARVQQLTSLRHKNIVMTYGAGVMEEKFGGYSIHLVNELMDGGTLSAILNNPILTLTLERKLQYLIDAAEGLTYLHSRKPNSFVHGALTPSKLFLSSENSIKIGGFPFRLFEETDLGPERKKDRRRSLVEKSQAVLRWLEEQELSNRNIMGVGIQTSTNVKANPLNFAAPEVLRGTLPTPASDVYSFALCIYAIMTRTNPFPAFTNRRSFLQALEKGLRPPLDSRVPVFLIELLVECWQNKPEKRPPMTEVTRRLKALESHPQVQTLIAAEMSEEARHAQRGVKTFSLPNYLQQAIARGEDVAPRAIPNISLCCIDLTPTIQALQKQVPLEQLTAALGGLVDICDTYLTSLNLFRVSASESIILVAGNVHEEQHDHALRCCDFAIRVKKLLAKKLVVPTQAQLGTWQFNGAVVTGSTVVSVEGKAVKRLQLTGDVMNSCNLLLRSSSERGEFLTHAATLSEALSNQRKETRKIKFESKGSLDTEKGPVPVYKVADYVIG